MISTTFNTLLKQYILAKKMIYIFDKIVFKIGEIKNKSRKIKFFLKYFFTFEWERTT